MLLDAQSSLGSVQPRSMLFHYIQITQPSSQNPSRSVAIRKPWTAGPSRAFVPGKGFVAIKKQPMRGGRADTVMTWPTESRHGPPGFPVRSEAAQSDAGGGKPKRAADKPRAGRWQSDKSHSTALCRPIVGPICARVSNPTAAANPMGATRDGDGDGLQRSDETADPANCPRRSAWWPGSGVAAMIASGVWKLHAADTARMRRNFSSVFAQPQLAGPARSLRARHTRSGLASVRHKTSCHCEAATPFGPSQLLRGRGIVSQVIRNTLI